MFCGDCKYFVMDNPKDFRGYCTRSDDVFLNAEDVCPRLSQMHYDKGVKRTERGWGGHFIMADRCLFRRNTLLEYADRRFVVSTVGACYVDGKLEEIGHERYYETMAFEAKLRGGYIEADVTSPIDCWHPWAMCAKSEEELLK